MASFGPGADETGRVNYALPPRGVAGGRPPRGLRNWDCRQDGHEDPDNSGLCIHCAHAIGEESATSACSNPALGKTCRSHEELMIVRIELTGKLETYLRALVATGLYGPDEAEAMLRLVEEGLRARLREGLLTRLSPRTR